MERLFLEEIIKFTQNIQGHNLSAIYTALCAPRAVEVVDGAHFYIISKKALKEGGGRSLQLQLSKDSGLD